MSYDEEQARRSRVVVETPTERREVVSQSVRTPDRSGVSAGMVGVLVVVAIALITMLVLFWMSQPATDTASSVTAAQPTTTVVQQPVPAQQPPVIIQQPAPVTTQPAPVIVTPPAGGATATTETAQPVNIDSTIQTEIDKRLLEDPVFSSHTITATVINGKVTLIGTVKTEDVKIAVERMARQVKGVKAVDNQITVL
jgi:hypothetical protein